MRKRRQEKSRGDFARIILEHEDEERPCIFLHSFRKNENERKIAALFVLTFGVNTFRIIERKDEGLRLLERDHDFAFEEETRPSFFIGHCYWIFPVPLRGPVAKDGEVRVDATDDISSPEVS